MQLSAHFTLQEKQLIILNREMAGGASLHSPLLMFYVLFGCLKKRLGLIDILALKYTSLNVGTLLELAMMKEN